MTDDFNRSHHDHEHAPPGPHILPAPLISKEVYLRDKCKWLPLDTDRLARSIFMRIANNEQLGAAFRLCSSLGASDQPVPFQTMTVGYQTQPRLIANVGHARLTSCSTASLRAMTAACITQ